MELLVQFVLSSRETSQRRQWDIASELWVSV